MLRVAQFLACAVLVVPPFVPTAMAQGKNPQPTPTLKVGDVLPPLKGDFLTGRDAQLPDAAKGKVALAMLGFTYDSRHAVEAWGEWFRQAFGPREDVTFFEVPMIGGFGKLGRWFIDSGMRKGTPKALHENVITVYSGVGDWKRRVGFHDAAEHDAYLILLDRDGVIRWLVHSPFDAARAAELREAAAALASPTTF